MKYRILVVLAIAHASIASAEFTPVSLDEFEVDVEWRVAKITFVGNDAIPADDLHEAILTKKRAWYAPWRSRPVFDAVTFEADRDRILRLYESRGYYTTKIEHELIADRDNSLVNATLRITEGPAVTVRQISLPEAGTNGQGQREVRERLPLKVGDVFDEELYQRGEKFVRAYYLDKGYAHVETNRSAAVDLEADLADIEYRAESGPPTFFGDTQVVGVENVAPELVSREIRYDIGEQFSLEKLEETRARVLALELFRSVRMKPQTEGTPAQVPIVIEVEEGEPRDVRIGAGFGTGEGVRGQLQWRHRNWFGGGRQLLLSIRASQITNEADATFIQPHLFSSPVHRGIISLQVFEEDEATFTLSAIRLTPRIEHQLTQTVTANIGYRIEYGRMSSVDDPTINGIGGFRRGGVLSGPTGSLLWDTTINPLNPQGGHVAGVEILQAGELWGGKFNFWRVVFDFRKYQAIGWQTVAAMRLRLGLADAIGSIENLPLFERFYAGGERGVRGYARRRLGPLGDSDRPLGGRSLFEGSLEMRRPIWGDLGGAVFVDFGQVSLDAFDPPVSDLEYAVGGGITYSTPIGPLRLDLGIPLEPPPGDASWQIHFSIGHFF